MMTELFTGLAALIGGIGGYIISQRTARRDDFSTLIASYKEENQRSRDEIEKLKASNDQLNEKYNQLLRIQEQRDREMADLKGKMLTLQIAHHDLPFPMWLKDLGGTMLYVNDKFEKVFLAEMGKTGKDIIGKSDTEFWGDVIGTKFREEDLEALRNGGYWRGVTLLGIESNQHTYEVHKYIHTYGNFGNSHFIGIAGIAIPHEAGE